MRFRIAFALCTSLALIGAASWLRIYAAKNPTVNLVSVETAEELEQAFLADFLKPQEVGKAASSTSPDSYTDLLGRQLIMDYIVLSQNGGASGANLMALAEKYVESIPGIIETPEIEYDEINPVSNTRANFQKYAELTTLIYNHHLANVINAYPSEESLKLLDDDFLDSAMQLSKSYKAAVEELIEVPVPASIATKHRDLLNSFLSSALALEAIANTNTDSTASFAALIRLNNNLSTEKELIQEIAAVLTQNGV